MPSFGNHDRFRGLASIRSRVNVLSLQYSVLVEGMELFLQYSMRWVEGGKLPSAKSYKLGLSYPIAL